jgi:NAD(P)H-hydrate epimerase
VNAQRIITIAEMRAIDAASARLGVPTRTLMEEAGAAVAREVIARFPPPRRALVVCGPGANGGDGFVAARHLRDAGYEVAVFLLGAREVLQGDAASAAAAWDGPVAPLEQYAPGPDDVIIDALFGAGLSRPLDGAAAAYAASTAGKRVVAVDVPSGLSGDGEAPLGAVVQAEVTVTFVAKKPAHVLASLARRFCGEVIVADIGAPSAALETPGPRCFENDPALWRDLLPFPGEESHKHRRGRVLVWGGHGPDAPSLTLGAQRLSALAAMRIGAGWVALAIQREDAALCATPAAMLTVPATMDAAKDAHGFDAVVFGPGAGRGPHVKTNTLALARSKQPLVLDADALSVFEGEPEQLFSALHSSAVLTPHEGEFRRLFPDLAEGGSPLATTRMAAARAGSVLLRKGPSTIIAAPDGRAIINTHATPWLARAGTGDVLAGFIAGLLAQGMPAFEAAAAAAWLHGDAGLRLGAGLIADDLPNAVRASLNRLAPQDLKRKGPPWA